MTKKKNPYELTRAEELEVLKALTEKVRRDPSLGAMLLQKAGITDENGQLTEKYRDE